MDIVGFTHNVDTNYNATIDEQLAKFDLLAEIINSWLIKNKDKIHRYWVKSTGDGYIIVFTNHILPLNLVKYLHNEEYIQTAKNNLQVNSELKKRLELKLRIGINSGTVKPAMDIQGNEDLIGTGINFASRCMSLDDGEKGGHIIANSDYISKLKSDYGMKDIPGDKYDQQEVKHGILLDVYNIFGDGFGDSSIPAKIKVN